LKLGPEGETVRCLRCGRHNSQHQRSDRVCELICNDNLPSADSEKEVSQMFIPGKTSALKNMHCSFIYLAMILHPLKQTMKNSSDE
jgi:hypothetical protein